MDISNSPQLVHALAPTVAVMDNGPSKGGAVATFDVIKASPGLQDLWALHQVPANDAQHNADESLTANLEGPDDAHWLQAQVEPDGSYNHQQLAQTGRLEPTRRAESRLGPT